MIRCYMDFIISVNEGNLPHVQQLWGRFHQIHQADFEPALMHALSVNEYEIANWLIQNGANTQYKSGSSTPLFEAIYSVVDADNVETIQLLLDYGADVNVKESDGTAPLHSICLCAHSNAKESKLLVEAAKLLIDHGADVNATDDQGDTPLHLACVRQRLEMIELLTGNGANIHAQNDKKDTPFFLACRNRLFEVAKMLVDLGVKVDGKDHCGMTALHRACKAGDLDAVKFLLAHGADVRMQATQCKKYLLFKWLMGVWYRLTHGPIGMVLLQLLPNIRIMAAFFVAKLLAHCASECLKKARIGPTPLYFACEANHLDLVWFMVRQEPWRVERGVQGWERRAGVNNKR